MIEREKIIEIAIKCEFMKQYETIYSATTVDIEVFYKAAQADAFEQAAKLCDAQQLEPECPERAAYCADAIRQLGKEKS